MHVCFMYSYCMYSKDTLTQTQICALFSTILYCVGYIFLVLSVRVSVRVLFLSF